MQNGCGVQAIPRDIQGGYTLPLGTLAKAGDTVLVSQHNPAMQDIAQSLTNSLSRDGRGQMLAPLRMGNQSITGLLAGSAPTDAVTVGQIGDLVVTGSRHVTFIATAGQTRFPATGDFTNDDGGADFSYTPASVAVNKAGSFLGLGADYTAAGGKAAIVLSAGATAGQAVTVYASIGVGSAAAPTSDELSITDYPRQTGDDAVAQIGPDTKRMYRMRDAAATAGKNMFAPAGVYEVWENTQAVNETITGLLGTDVFVLRGAGIDKTIFRGTGDVLAVFYGNRQPRGTVNAPQITEPGSTYAIKRVELSHLTIQQPGLFLEQATAIGIAAASNVHIHDVKIDGFAGDAISALMANFGDGSQQGHNSNWLVERVIIDGKGNYSYRGGNNRQGITINDMVNYTERDCQVLNATRPGDGNQTAEDRTKPNTGPPMPGAGDIEFISGTIFDVRAANTLVERRIVRNSGGAGDVLNLAKANRTNPPFPATGTNAADLAVLIQSHKRVGMIVDNARLGLMTADAPPSAAVGFGAEYEGSQVTNSGRSYEVTRFRGLKMSRNWFYRSGLAGTLGYPIDTEWYMRDYESDGDTYEQVGLLDGLAIGIFQGENLAFKNTKFLNCNGTMMRISGPIGVVRRTKNLTFDGLTLQNDGLAGLPSLVASIIVVPESGETLNDAINRLLDVRTVTITNAKWGGVALPNFPHLNGQYPSVPRVGAWLTDDRVFCSSIDPGAPEGWKAIAGNAFGALPRMVRYGIKGMPAADVTGGNYNGAMTPSAGVMRDVNGRFTSFNSQQLLLGSVPIAFSIAGSSGAEVIFRGVYDRTSMLFVGFRPSGATDAATTNFTGVWFDGGYGGSQQRVAYINGNQQSLQGAFFHDQFTRLRIYDSAVFGLAFRVYTGPSETGPWTPTGAPMAYTGATSGLQLYTLFGLSGESFQGVSYNSNTGRGDA